jgi:hypothetical protein
MFRTNSCSSSEGLYKQLTVFHRASYEESSHWHDTTNYINRTSVTRLLINDMIDSISCITSVTRLLINDMTDCIHHIVSATRLLINDTTDCIDCIMSVTRLFINDMIDSISCIMSVTRLLTNDITDYANRIVSVTRRKDAWRNTVGRLYRPPVDERLFVRTMPRII